MNVLNELSAARRDLKGGVTPGDIVAWAAVRASLLGDRVIEAGGTWDTTSGVEGKIRCSECRGTGVTSDGLAWCDHCRYGWTDPPACPVCRGAGRVRRGDYRPGRGGDYSVPCRACQGDEAAVYARLRRAGVPEKYQILTLDGWRDRAMAVQAPAAMGSYKAAHAIGIRLATMRPPDGNDRAGLLLTGQPGRMKSGLAAGIIHEVARLGAVCRWLSWGVYCDRLNELREAGQSTRIEIEGDAAADVLVIDDLGSDGLTSDSRTRILTDILERRGAPPGRVLPTVVTTMLGLDELESRYGAHVVSRLIEVCTPCVLTGADARR